MSGPPKWDNLSSDGRRLERIIKFCETMITNEANNTNRESDDLILAYIDRLIKATLAKEKIADMVLGISHVRKLAEKKYEQPKYYLPPVEK